MAFLIITGKDTIITKNPTAKIISTSKVKNAGAWSLTIKPVSSSAVMKSVTTVTLIATPVNIAMVINFVKFMMNPFKYL